MPIFAYMSNVPRYRVASHQNLCYQCYLWNKPHIVKKFWRGKIKSVGATVREIYIFWYILPNMANVPRYRIMSDQNFCYQCFLLFTPHIVEKFWEDWMKSIGAMVFTVFFFGICCQIWQMYQGIETCETKIFFINVFFKWNLM